MPPVRKCKHNNSAKFPSDCGCWDHTPNEKTVEVQKLSEHTYTFPPNLTSRQRESIADALHKAYQHGKEDTLISLHHQALEEKKKLVNSILNCYSPDDTIHDYQDKIKALAERHNINIK